MKMHNGHYHMFMFAMVVHLIVVFVLHIVCHTFRFFVCEEHILNTTSGLVTRNYIDELWELAVKKIVNQLKTYSAYCTDAQLSLTIKNTIVLFCHTMKVSSSEKYRVNISLPAFL